MSKVYFTSLESNFAKELAALFEKYNFTVTTEYESGIEYFISASDVCVAGDDKEVGQGIDADAAVLAYRQTVCEPLAKLERVLPWMVGKKRICFINSMRSSVNCSAEVSGYGRNMSGAALNLIVVLTKNGMISRGYTFRIFDPLTGQVDTARAARIACGYFMRDRFCDDPSDGIGRNDELNVVPRDALGREIPW